MQRTQLEEWLMICLGTPEPDDDLMWRVTRGEVSVRDAIAQRDAHEDEETAARRAALFVPPTPEEHERALNELLDRCVPGTESGTQNVGGAADGMIESEIDDDLVGSSADRRVRRFPPLPRARRSRSSTSTRPCRASWSRWAWASAALAAVLLLLLVVPPGPPREEAEATSMSGPRLPAYEVHWSGGYSGPVRSSSAAATTHCDQTLRANDELALELTPAETVTDDIEVAILARSERTTQRRWIRVHALVSRSGAVMIRERLTQLELGPDRWILTFYIGNLPSPRTMTHLAAGRHPGVTVTRSRLCVVRPSSPR